MQLPDLKYLYSLSDGDTEFEKEMLKIFLSESSKDLNIISTGLKEKDSESCRSMAHKFKSKLRMTGFIELMEVAERIEKHLNEKLPFEKIESSIIEFIEGVQKAQKSIAELIEKKYS